MGVIRISGQIDVGPACASDCGTFPGATAQVALGTTPCQKASQVDSGFNRRNLNSPNAYATLSGVGANDNVTQGDTVYVRTQSPCMIRATFYNPAQPNSPIVSEFPLQGTFLIEPPQGQYLSLLEAKGVGLVEYLVSGQQ